MYEAGNLIWFKEEETHTSTMVWSENGRRDTARFSTYVPDHTLTVCQWLMSDIFFDLIQIRF